MAHGDLVAAHLRPAPPYDAGPEAADLGATAMIDVSDGLVGDGPYCAAAASASTRHEPARPGARPLQAAAAAYELPSRWMLIGGDDHRC